MIKKIIKTYLLLFLVFFVAYSFINWLLTTKTGLLKIDTKYSSFWLPFIIVCIPVFFLLRPLVKSSGFNSKFHFGLSWVLLPFSISIPTAISQQYFRDASYPVINVNTPEDVLAYPKQRFFHIGKFHIDHAFFTLYKERHVSGIRSKTLKVNNYFIAPLPSDNVSGPCKIAYGIKFSESLNHGYLFRKNQPQKIDEFNKKSEERFLKLDLYDVSFFEKQMNSEEAQQFAKAWQKNDLLVKDTDPIVLVNKIETYQQLLKRERTTTIYSTLISITIMLFILFIFNFYRR